MRTTIIAGAAAAVAVIAVAGMALAPFFRGSDAFADCTGGQPTGGAIGGPFTLVDAEGRTVTDADVLATPSLIYFGFTSCPDICPLDMARNGQAADLLEERGIEATPVFVSVDPDRDTPEIVGQYARNFHPRAIGLTGSAEQVAEAARAYRVFYDKEETGDDFYQVNHSTYSYIVLPGHGFVDVVDREESAESVADRLQCFVEAAA